MDQTPRLGLRFPEDTDSPDVPRDVQNLAEDVEALSNPLATRSVLEPGLLNQTKAGRQLAVTDFTAIGLSTPLVLACLGDLTNPGSEADLSNKGAVPFGTGITATAAEAAVFAGSTGQALYLADSAGLSIKTGSWGCWFRTAKRGTAQFILAKYGAGGTRSFTLSIESTNVAGAFVSFDGTAAGASLTGVSDICDDRWHFAAVTFDGTTLRLYVDGVLEASAQGAGTIFDGTAPLNIGAYGADAGTAATSPHYGRVDEAFLTADVLSEDQIRYLMCAKVAHGLAQAPRRVGLSVRRRRRGPVLTRAALATALGVAEANILRLHNLDGLTDLGANGVALTANGGMTAGQVPGPDGLVAGGSHLDGTDDYLSATDTGLPAAAATRTLFAWFKTTQAAAAGYIVAYGNTGVQDDGFLSDANGTLSSLAADSGVFVADGLWHLAAMVCDNAAADGVKEKLYLDGKLVGGATSMRAPTLVGANGFRVGVRQNGTSFFRGQIARAGVLDVALTGEQIATLYALGGQDLGQSPYPPGEVVERLDATNLHLLAADLQSQEQLDLEVAA